MAAMTRAAAASGAAHARHLVCRPLLAGSRLRAQVQRGRLGGNLVRRLAERGAELVLQRSHNVLSSR